MDWIVVAYYTKDTLYEKQSETLIQSLERFHIPYDVQAVPNLGSWNKNTAYKPTFLKGMIEKHASKSIVYVDCDAEFLRYPELFDTLTCDIAVHLLDRKCYGDQYSGFELLSGTIWLANNDNVSVILDNWEKECSKNHMIWDQRCLEKVLRIRGHVDTLPADYCKIFDRNQDAPDPVIVHYQASRIVRKNRGKLK